jgi:hypothetical protein
MKREYGAVPTTTSPRMAAATSRCSPALKPRDGLTRSNLDGYGPSEPVWAMVQVDGRLERPLKVMFERLGHSMIALTANLYTRTCFRAATRAAANLSVRRARTNSTLRSRRGERFARFDNIGSDDIHALRTSFSIVNGVGWNLIALTGLYRLVGLTGDHEYHHQAVRIGENAKPSLRCRRGPSHRVL